jgi:hypothetical protein
MSNQSLCDLQTDALKYARLRFRDGLDWVSYLRDVQDYCEQLMGPEEAFQFFREPKFREVHGMIVQLAIQYASEHPTRVITVRMPRELHIALRNEASDRSTSLNRLCIAKLLGTIGETSSGVLLGAELLANGAGEA